MLSLPRNGLPGILRQVLCGFALLLVSRTVAATLTVQTNQLGSTPAILGLNSGHFYPGSNTREWWRYSGVRGARVFIAPSAIEPGDDLSPVGDGVNSLAAFMERRAAIRTNQFNPLFINWPVFTNNYVNNDLAPVNHIRVNFALAELRKIDVQILAQITASQSRFPIAGTTDWPNMWELWQHYYAQAFYLGRYFDVERYQVYNEPNHPNANGLTATNFLLRLQLASDAVQLALADVNTLYGKSLSPKLVAPVTSGSADGSYPGWGEVVVTNRHQPFFGAWDPSFSLIQTYDYHQYNSAPSTFGTALAALNGLLAGAMAPETRFPTSISEFNTHTGATFDSMLETLDSPSEYARLGAIAVNLIANGCSELYCFKFSQTDYTGNYPVAKNALHYVDNDTSPYNVGGVTRAGEAWRLLNKAFAPGRRRLGVVKGAGATGLDVLASYDPAAQRYYLYLANYTASAVVLNLDLGAWDLPVGGGALIEEVSEKCYGTGVLWTNLPAGKVLSGTQGAYTVWLITALASPKPSELTVTATEDAEVRDGGNKTNNYGTGSGLVVRNDPVDASQRSVAFLKFQLPTNSPGDLKLAILKLQASASSRDTNAQAHVYGLTNTAWEQNTITWSTAPNLKDNVAAGASIGHGVVEGVGTNVMMLGQLVVNSTQVAEKLVDVTDYVRTRTNGSAAFLVAQDPRWNVALPSLAPGDIQPDGIRIASMEGGAAATLQLVFNTAVASSVPVWTNISVSGEATIRGGAYADTNPDELATNYLAVKYNSPSLDNSRKTYFQFDVSGLAVEPRTQAFFTVNFTVGNQQRVQLWGMRQAYTGFSPDLTWNTAQANDTASNEMLTNGIFSASPIGAAALVPASGTTPFTFSIPDLSLFLISNRVTLVLCGVYDAGNNSGGARLQRTNSTLNLLAYFPAGTQPTPPAVTGIRANGDGTVTVSFSGRAGEAYLVQAASNLVSPFWVNVQTSTASQNGTWTFTDPAAAVSARRFYRCVTP